jgi:hypothetical protein
MSIFSWLQQSLEQNQQSGCETTPEAEKFVNRYSEQVEAEKQSLRERQAQERQERSSKRDR